MRSIIPPSSGKGRPAAGDPALARKLQGALKGEVMFDAFSRGRYSADASIYQIEPIGVAAPADEDDLAAALEIAAGEGVPVLARGAGTSQSGQAVGEALVLDCSRHMNGVLSIDVEARAAVVQPGVVLDRLNARLKPHGLMFPVDVSTAAQATIGGMTANNSCGSRSLRYGNMVHNVLAIEGLLADGSRLRFGEHGGETGDARLDGLAARLLALHHREADEIALRFPKVKRRVGGYNLDRLAGERPNLARLLVGSEGTLALFRSIEIALQPIPRAKALGVCHFPSFREAMEAVKPIVGLRPAAVELVDRSLIELGRDIPMYRAVMDRFIRGEPQALLFVEFAGDGRDAELANLKRLVELMGDLGFPGGVVEAVEPAFQSAIWEVRKGGLNIMMSMKGDAKPVSFIEDCAVPLEHLPDYTGRLTEAFARHGTTGTWYAHASEGCLHVRPILNLKQEMDVRKMRALAEEAFALVREYKGSHSGEHGDGLVRSEFLLPMYGERLTAAFAEVKALFDPENRLNPGKIVNPSKMDDRSLMRFKPGYGAVPLETALDWSEWGGMLGAAEMCNNNGACRKRDAAVMCPSFRATGEERHVTRGRANALRLALSGQLGPDALTSPGMDEALELCVSCKGCKRECPTGVDMARLKIEALYQRQKRRGLSLRDRLISWLPRYAPMASRVGWALNALNGLGAARAATEWLTGFTRRRPLPRWSARPFSGAAFPVARPAGDVALFADCFNRWFEAGTARAAVSVLNAAGYNVHVLQPADGGRPLCCGRTFFASGLVDQAREELSRVLEAARPFVAAGVPVIGLEPSCLLTLRDEVKAVLPGPEAEALAGKALLFEEFLAAEQAAGRLTLELKPVGYKKALLHGHCHQKAHGAMPAVEVALRLIPGLEVSAIQSSCCGMAGAFGHHKEHYDVSMRMAEDALLPAVRAADEGTVVVADGVSCRSQIGHGVEKEAVHVAVLLEMALKRDGG